MLKSLFFLVGLAVSLSLQAQVKPTQSAKRMVEKFERISAPTFSTSQQKAVAKCLKKTQNRFWIVVNIGTTENPLLKGFCRKTEPVPPFINLV